MSERNLLACPRCGAEIGVQNAAIVRTGTRCSNCERWETIDPSSSEPWALVVNELGWCACGAPEDVDRMMVAYLNSRHTEGHDLPAGMAQDTQTLLGYLADDLGWTEHGGTIVGAWLTPAGAEALKNLRARDEA